MLEFIYYLVAWLDFSWLITLPKKEAKAAAPPKYREIDPLLRE